MDTPNECTHPEVRAWADGDTDGWAHCTICEADLTATWFTSDARHDYVLVPRTLGRTQHFVRPALAS